MTTPRDDERNLLDTLFEGAYRVDLERTIVYWNPAAEKLTGFAADEVVGTKCSDGILEHVDDAGCRLCLSQCPLADTMSDGESREAKVYFHHRDGYRVPITMRCSALRDAGDAIIGGLEVFTTASASEVLERRIEEFEGLAYLDALTEVANRRFADINLAQYLEEHRRYRWPFGLVLFDIDHFKAVNDRHGHAVGDRVLKMVARTLGLTARGFDLVARWGGEEFLVLVRNVEDGLFEQVAERFRALIAAAFLDLDGDRVGVTVSGGATTAREDDDPASILERADRLLYASKTGGRDQISFG